MNDLEMDIMAYLIVRKEVTLQQVAKYLNVTEKQIQKALKNINTQYEFTLIESQKEKSFINNTYIDQVYYSLKNRDRIVFPVNLRREVLLTVLLINNRAFSLTDLADKMDVSKNTILSDLKIIREKITQKSCDIVFLKKQGYSPKGDEFTLRKLLIESVSKIVAVPVGKWILFEEHLLDQKEVILLQKRLEIVEERLNILFSDEMVETLPYTAYSIILRKENSRVSCTITSEIKTVIHSREFEIISSAFWNYRFLEENDLVYLAILVLSSNLIDSESTLYNTGVLEQAVTQFIMTIESKLAIQFSDIDLLKKILMQHIRPALYRAELGISIVNPLSSQFIDEYRSIYLLIKQEMTIFDPFTPKPFSEDETAFIAMIVLSNIMEFSKQKEERPFNAVVVCKSGTSISKMLFGTLKEMFPFIHFKETYSARQFEFLKIDIDFVFSTVPLQTNQDVLLVSPYMSKKDRENLKRRVEQKIDSSTVKKAKYILSFLGDYLKQEKEQEAIVKLSKFLAEEKVEPNSIEQINGGFLLSKDQISIVKEKWEWDECIKKSFNPVLDRKSVDKNYIDSCEQAFYQFYETMLIGPDVLLPHVTFEEGVKRADVHISILKEPLIDPKGNGYNILMALAPGEFNEHVNWLIWINEEFVSGNLKEKLLTANSSEEALEFIEGKKIDELR